MRVIGLLSWYDEPVEWLAECVAAAARLCDHLIAADGAYAMYPGALRRPASPGEQGDVIARTAAGCGIGATVHVPREPWWGGEVGKRDWMFRAAELVSGPDDWVFVVDADEMVSAVPGDTKAHLAASNCDVAEVRLWDRLGTHGPDRRLLRAQRGLACQGAHYLWTAPAADGGRQVLRGNSFHDLAPALPLWDVEVEHRKDARPAHRQAAKREYYSHLPDIETAELS